MAGLPGPAPAFAASLRSAVEEGTPAESLASPGSRCRRQCDPRSCRQRRPRPESMAKEVAGAQDLRGGRAACRRRSRQGRRPDQRFRQQSQRAWPRCCLLSDVARTDVALRAAFLTMVHNSRDSRYGASEAGVSTKGASMPDASRRRSGDSRARPEMTAGGTRLPGLEARHEGGPAGACGRGPAGACLLARRPEARRRGSRRTLRGVRGGRGRARASVLQMERNRAHLGPADRTQATASRVAHAPRICPPAIPVR